MSAGEWRPTAFAVSFADGVATITQCEEWKYWHISVRAGRAVVTEEAFHGREEFAKARAVYLYHGLVEANKRSTAFMGARLDGSLRGIEPKERIDEEKNR